MTVTAPVLILVALAFFFLTLGQDPNKKHGVFAALCIVLAACVFFYDAEAGSVLARLGRE